MAEIITLSELLAAVLVLFGLGLSCWALVDDVWDLYHVSHFGEVGGPRWVAASEHFLFNGTLLLGWLMMLGLVGIAVYLPPRPDQAASGGLPEWAGWFRLGFVVSVLVAQVHRRVGRQKLRSLPLESWERMLAAMFDGLTVEERASLTERLLHATAAGRQMGHLIANRLSSPVGLIDLVMASAVLTEQQRADLEEARDAILAVADRAAGLHIEIRDQEQHP